MTEGEKIRGRPRGVSKAGLETKATILSEASRLFAEKSYATVGLGELLSAAQCPKGSFYHYFASKEALAIELVRTVRDRDNQAMKSVVATHRADPLRAVRRIFEAVIERVETGGPAHACLVAKLSIDAPMVSEKLRDEVSATFALWARTMSEGLKAAQNQKQISQDMDVRALAEFLIIAWQGALSRVALVGDAEPLHTFIEIVFEGFLPGKGEK